MKRILTIVSVLSMLTLATTASAQTYSWTVSASQVDPHVNMTSHSNSILFVWYYCSPDAIGDFRGMAAAEFGLEVTGGTVLGIVPINGFLNAGLGTELLLAVGGCPSGPLAAAQMFVSDQGMEVCFRPSAANGILGTVDCGASPQIHPMAYVGFSTQGAPCEQGFLICQPTTVESESWGSIKGLYR